MKVRGVKSDVFGDYKKTSLAIIVCDCDFKCENENLCDKGSCQNSELYNTKVKNILNSDIIEAFNKNDLIKAILFTGLEPMLQFNEILEFIKEFRKSNNDDIVIYTGYTEAEISKEVEILKQFDNIIIKFGRYIQSLPKIYDEVLGVHLASSNQYAKHIK